MPRTGMVATTERCSNHSPARHRHPPRRSPGHAVKSAQIIEMPRERHTPGAVPAGPARYSTAWAAQGQAAAQVQRARRPVDGDAWQRGATVVIALSAIATAIAALAAALPR